MLLCSTIDWGKSMNAIFFDHLVSALHFVRKQWWRFHLKCCPWNLYVHLAGAGMVTDIGYRMMLTLRDEQQVDDRFISVQSFICDHFLDPRFLHGQYFTFLSTSVKPSFIFHQYFEDATKIAISNVRLGFHFLNRLKVRKTYSLTAMLTFSFSLYFLLNGQRWPPHF